jgi:hypothetical protein
MKGEEKREEVGGGKTKEKEEKNKERGQDGSTGVEDE